MKCNACFTWSLSMACDHMCPLYMIVHISMHIYINLYVMVIVTKIFSVSMLIQTLYCAIVFFHCMSITWNPFLILVWNRTLSSYEYCAYNILDEEPLLPKKHLYRYTSLNPNKILNTIHRQFKCKQKFIIMVL
jgi:hypothetical protein